MANEQELQMGIREALDIAEWDGGLITLDNERGVIKEIVTKLKAMGYKSPEECAECKNLRKFLKDNNASKVIEAMGYEQVWTKCPECKGEGELFHRGVVDTLKAWSKCLTCKGTGQKIVYCHELYERKCDLLNDYGLDCSGWQEYHQGKALEKYYAQILALFPDIEKVECAFEDWDDTTLPRPICHCLKRDGIDCANVPDDVKACPDFMTKEDWGIEEAKREERERIIDWLKNCHQYKVMQKKKYTGKYYENVCHDLDWTLLRQALEST